MASELSDRTALPRASASAAASKASHIEALLDKATCGAASRCELNDDVGASCEEELRAEDATGA